MEAPKIDLRITQPRIRTESLIISQFLSCYGPWKEEFRVKRTCKVKGNKHESLSHNIYHSVKKSTKIVSLQNSNIYTDH